MIIVSSKQPRQEIYYCDSIRELANQRNKRIGRTFYLNKLAESLVNRGFECNQIAAIISNRTGYNSTLIRRYLKAEYKRKKKPNTPSKVVDTLVRNAHRSGLRRLYHIVKQTSLSPETVRTSLARQDLEYFHRGHPEIAAKKYQPTEDFPILHASRRCQDEWLAKLLVGEGYLGLVLIRGRHGNFWLSPRISIGLKNFDVIACIQAILGYGSVSQKNGFWSFCCSSGQSMRFFERIENYLGGKHKQVKIFREFINRREFNESYGLEDLKLKLMIHLDKKRLFTAKRSIIEGALKYKNLKPDMELMELLPYMKPVEGSVLGKDPLEETALGRQVRDMSCNCNFETPSWEVGKWGIAALIDGEGSIRSPIDRFAGCYSVGYQCTISNCDLDLLNHARTITGLGHLYIDSGSTGSKLTFRRQETKDLLHTIAPLLIVRKNQARILLQFIKRREQEGAGNYSISDLKNILELHILNRGRPKRSKFEGALEYFNITPDIELSRLIDQVKWKD